MKVKVCGIRNLDNLHYLQKSDVDMIGFIFYDRSKRFFKDGNIALSEMRNTTKEKVGVFVNASLEDVEETIEKYDLTMVQLHGEESPAYCDLIKEMGVSVMKAFSVLDELPKQLSQYDEVVDIVLFDTKGAEHGGNGVQFDWEILESYDLKTPFMVSGGIGPEDVTKLKNIMNKKMIGVDINSRFEIQPGLKNEDLLEEFIKEIKR